jgi:hypothetical protein
MLVNFATAAAVKFGTTTPKAVMVGSVRVWPKVVASPRIAITPPANWTGPQRCKESNNETWASEGLSLPTALQTIQIAASDKYAIPPVDSSLLQSLEQQSSYLSLTEDGKAIFGKGMYQPRNDGALQNRYGGDYDLPRKLAPGDVIYWHLAMDVNYWQTPVLKIVII